MAHIHDHASQSISIVPSHIVMILINIQLIYSDAIEDKETENVVTFEEKEPVIIGNTSNKLK